MKSDHHGLYPERSGIETSDPEIVQKYLDHAYAARFEIVRADDSGEPAFCSHTRTEVDRYALEEIRYDGDVRLHANHVPAVIAVTPVQGRAESTYGGLTAVAGPGEWVLASTGLDGLDLRLTDAQLRSVVLDRSLISEVAAAHVDEPSQPLVRFTDLTPRDANLAHTLGAAERFLHSVLSTPEAVEASILLGAAGRMLASAVLAAFPNDLPQDDTDEDLGDDHPALLHQAVEFIEHNAARDIGIGDVAAAVYLTPRTVQYMFRKHLDTTPMSYLREVRMKRAREELLASDRTITTVAAVGARWGFAHTGRFAVHYRDSYGESPHETLRR